MNADHFLDAIIRPGCDHLSNIMSRQMGSPEALVMLLAIAMQESGLEHRRQIRGPARGWFQFESGGGVLGVMQHDRGMVPALAICVDYHIPWSQSVIHEAIAWHDGLAVAFARLLLWTDPEPLPLIDDREGAWDCYVLNWRPGKPKPKAWPGNYATAVEQVRGAA